MHKLTKWSWWLFRAGPLSLWLETRKSRALKIVLSFIEAMSTLVNRPPWSRYLIIDTYFSNLFYTKDYLCALLKALQFPQFGSLFEKLSCCSSLLVRLARKQDCFYLRKKIEIWEFLSGLEQSDLYRCTLWKVREEVWGSLKNQSIL